LRYADVLGLSIATYPQLYPPAMARGLCELVGRLKYWDQQKALTEEPVDAEWLLYLTSIIPAMEVSLARRVSQFFNQSVNQNAFI